jgi:choline dehydrogenase-like flavoprotein
MVDFDYVIVGAGAVGCGPASRLSGVPGNQVPLEYGGGDTSPLLDVRKGYYFTLRGNRCTYHAVGASATPPDVDNVAGIQMRVRGVTGLRVARASVLPVQSPATLRPRDGGRLDCRRPHPRRLIVRR